MYVCVCHAVTERQIHEAAAAGAKTLKDLRRDLGVASDCGRCTSCARQCLKDAHATSAKGHHCALVCV
ncbi:MAG TPA: (2Fe-2S)-binding protein [Rhodocyclaceae bacterium]|jgi:bacterioferritin-associated ferredoxin|nr:(2Fe-2S)-binding protein [Betaproteobacteria bacterium]HMU99544.1 (2Fe-2S)-binding protein [Rhodocyclaceae bacterium]HMV20138.1 (2Fe-2S)-binding protein [Rhodocyclaceae bacterium]HMW77173.1 (2Fe-2S)-binding protein [Rhodocyclaceae bacterium]HNE41666.1 (2Fe-2S)-binding protein [Rhodocyclaceae bacterium]